MIAAVRAVSRVVLAVLLAACAFTVLEGCAGAQKPRTWSETARLAVVGSAHAVAASDALADARYRQEAPRVRGDSDATAALEARYDTVEQVLTVAAASVRDAEGALDAYDAHQGAPERCRLSVDLHSAARQVLSLIAVFSAAGLDVPPDLGAQMGQLESLSAQTADACVNGGGT
jgi:hypothetical protein